MKKAVFLTLLSISFFVTQGQTGVEFRVTLNIEEELLAINQSKLENLLPALCKLLSEESLAAPDFCSESSFQDDIALLEVYSFRDFWEANDFKGLLKDHGYPTARIAAYRDNEPVPVKDILTGAVTSLKKEGNTQRIEDQPVFEEEGIVFRILLNPSVELEDQTLATDDLIDTLCELITSYSTDNWDLSDYDCSRITLHIQTTPDKFLIIDQGHADYWEVDALKKRMRKQGFSSAFLVGYKNGRRTPMKDIAEELGW